MSPPPAKLKCPFLGTFSTSIPKPSSAFGAWLYQGTSVGFFKGDDVNIILPLPGVDCWQVHKQLQNLI